MTRTQSVTGFLPNWQTAMRRPDVVRRMETHLKRCSSCRESRDWNDRLTSLVSNDVPPVLDDVQWRVQALLYRRRAMRRRGALAALATVACLVLAIGVDQFVYRKSIDPARHQGSIAAKEPSGTEHDDLADLTLLVSAPPVTSVGRSQAAWLAVLAEASEGKPQ